MFQLSRTTTWHLTRYGPKSTNPYAPELESNRAQHPLMCGNLGINACASIAKLAGETKPRTWTFTWGFSPLPTCEIPATRGRSCSSDSEGIDWRFARSMARHPNHQAIDVARIIFRALASGLLKRYSLWVRCMESLTSPTSSSIMSSRNTTPTVLPSLRTRERCAPECCIATSASSASSLSRLTARLR